MSRVKGQKNYGKLLNSLNFVIPGLPNIARAPDAYTNRDLVDVYMAKRRLELVHLLPEFNVDVIRYRSHVDTTFEQLPNIDRNFLSNLMASGYVNVLNEIASLAKEERLLLSQPEISGRDESFTDDPTRLNELVHGLIACAEAEKTDKIFEKVRCRQSLGEKMIHLGDFWLARKLLLKAFSYLEYYDAEDLDKLRVELWCLLSYVCIYYENSQQVGFNLPSKCLTLAQQVCQGQSSWHMPKTVMSIFIPKPINVYGLKNQWIKIQADYVSMNVVVTTLLHVLCVKKAKYWQDELQSLESLEERQWDKERWIKDKIVDTLTSALALADQVTQSEVFVATTLRRGLFFEERGEWEKAMEDFNAMHILSLNYDDKEAIAIAMNRIGQNHKNSGNVEKALEHFACEYEISCENELEELRADALQDLGFLLLEEGHTWEAEECLSQAYEMFHETKQLDTPNNLDDLSWAMMGVARGQHLWGRFSTLIRTQEKTKIDAIYEWKVSRKAFPLASMSSKWYKTETRQEFDKNYADCIPDPNSSKRSKKSRRTPVTFQEVVGNQTDRERESTSLESPKRRLFEFSSKEVKSRPTVWLRQQGYRDMFDLINASNKPRNMPKMLEGVEWMNNSEHDLEQLKVNEEDDMRENFMHRRKTEAVRRASRRDQSIYGTNLSRVTFTGKEISSWMSHDYRRKTWVKESKSPGKLKEVMMDPKMGMGERLVALLEDMQGLTNLELDKGRFGSGGEDDIGGVVTFAKPPSWSGDDESEDSELTRKSRMPSGLLEELANFDASQLGF